MLNAFDQQLTGIKKQYFTLPEPLTLESGAVLAPVTLAYETYGQPNPDRSNAILILHGLTGDSHAAGIYLYPPLTPARGECSSLEVNWAHNNSIVPQNALGNSSDSESCQEEDKPGWWDNMIGPGKAFDTNRYWVICSNILGGCQGSTGPSSINPQTGMPYGLDFPIVTIGDMVKAQSYLINALGIQQLYAVAGGSLGGFQALEWALRFPDRVRTVICLASAPKLSAQGIAFNAVGRHAITCDPDWQQGQYYVDGAFPQSNRYCTGSIPYGSGIGPEHGLATARMLAHITYLSEQSLEEKFGRRLQSAQTLQYAFKTEFAVESYLSHQGQKFIERFDANSYLYITKAMDYFDIEYYYGSLPEAFSRTNAKFLIVSFSTDWLFPTEESRKIVRALRQNHLDISFIEIDSPHGHDAFLLEGEQLRRVILPFLEHAASTIQVV